MSTAIPETDPAAATAVPLELAETQEAQAVGISPEPWDELDKLKARLRHDVRNLLNPITGLAAAVRSYHEDMTADEMAEAMQAILDSAWKLDALVEELAPPD